MNKIDLTIYFVVGGLFIVSFMFVSMFFEGLDVMRTVSFEGVEYILVFTYTITYFNLIFAGIISLFALCISLWLKIEHLKESPT